MAQYAIIRMEKFHVSDLQGIQKHNQRQGKSKSNLVIDSERSHLNYDLLNGQNLRYERIIKDEISERVKRKPRDNSVVLSEFLVTASPEYMKSLPIEEQKRYFERSLDFIQERYGERNTLYAVVHHDEANPHMHVGVIPITEDSRLSAKDIYNRTELQALQRDFPAEMQRQGFEVLRGEEGSKDKHLHPSEYKEKQDLEREMQLLEKKIVGKKKELIDLSEALPVGKLNIKVRPEIKTEVKQKLFGDAEIIKKETGNFVLTSKQLEELSGYVHAALAVKKSYDRLQSMDLVKQNKALETARDSFSNSLFLSENRTRRLENENRDLILENEDLKARIADLMLEIKKQPKEERDLRSSIFVKDHTK